MTENVDLNEKILYKKDVFGFFMGNALAMLIAVVMCLAICGSFVSSSTAEVKNYEEKITALEKKIEAQDQKIEEYKKIIYDLDEQVGEIKDNTPLPVDPYTGY